MSKNTSCSYQVRTARNELLGPVSLEELQRWVREGRIGEDHRISQVGSGVWGKVQDFPELGYNAAEQRQVIDFELKRTRMVRNSLLVAFLVPTALSIWILGLPAYDASEEIRVAVVKAGQAEKRSVSAEQKAAAARAEADTAVRRRNEAESALRKLQESSLRLQSDLDLAKKMAADIEGGTEQQARTILVLQSEIKQLKSRLNESQQSEEKMRLENADLRHKAERSVANAREYEQEAIRLREELDAELRKSIVQKVFGTK
jgi:regulator of replication initiation timing